MAGTVDTGDLKSFALQVRILLPAPTLGDAVKTLKVVPVIVDGEIQLYDVYIEGEWFGSRRTISQIKHIYPEYEIEQ
jgi:hypothetical protein